ncbi:myeloid differentiation primary response protein MyD88-like isoform X1 [Ruditapes philippinarum]|uniref:myeloid differentiation primary response protein MyD88-like isoform X1 n=1 Tax=Ruditapes philippinarum TaxID=129788 RepID=UPI00295C2D80|nr:myeloid differentiation primary response protein MyD88-like isoform X1 [Ruditapes philippinarum]
MKAIGSHTCGLITMACSKMSTDDIEMLFERTPVDALNVASRRILSDKLKNNGKLVELGDGSRRQVCDDYTGIAELENFHPEEIKDLSDSPDPVESLVSELAGKECTVGHLRRDLINMGRRSVVRMSHANWVNDCVVYEDKFENTRSSVNIYSRHIPDIDTDDDIDFDEGNYVLT